MIWGYVLQAEHSTLDGYVFQDWEHADRWMQQPYLAGERYAVHAALLGRRKCCGATTIRKLGAQMLQKGP